MVTAAFLGPQVAGLVSRLLGPVLMGVGLFAFGFAAAEAWEHRPPQGFPLSIVGQGLKTQRDRLAASIPAIKVAARQEGMTAQANADRPAFDKWSAALKTCDAQRTADRDAAAAAIDRARASSSSQASAAYRLGRATCGAPNAASPSPAGPPVAGSVRDAPDFRSIFGAGAYTPAAGGSVPPGR